MPRFQGSQIVLRPFEPDDGAELHAYLNQPELTGRRYLPRGVPETLPLARQQIDGVLSEWAGEKNGYHFATALTETGRLVGHAECDWGWDPHCPSVSIVIAPAHQRRGHGSEVLRQLLDYLFENTPAHNVSLWFAGWNVAARAFARKHGFTEAGRLRRAGFRDGADYDLLVADLLRPEWKEKFGGLTHAA